MKLKIAILFILLMPSFSLFSFTKAQETNLVSDNYQIMRFWDADVGECFFYQETSNSCVSASVQMVLRYFDFSPLPTQAQLAMEMHTDINHTTEWRYIYIPFLSRSFSEYCNQSLSNDFSTALSYLKSNISKNFPAIVNTWYNEQAKAEGKVTHARVITGYNSTGIFVHDPWDGPNIFLNYSTFSNLWETGYGYWALIVLQEPKFDLIVEIKDLLGNPISKVTLNLEGKSSFTELTDSKGTAKFENLTIGNYVLSYNWRFQAQKGNITLTKTTKVSYSLFLSNQIILICVFAVFLIVLVVVLKKRVFKVN